MIPFHRLHALAHNQQQLLQDANLAEAAIQPRVRKLPETQQVSPRGWSRDLHPRLSVVGLPELRAGVEWQGPDEEIVDAVAVLQHAVRALHAMRDQDGAADRLGEEPGAPGVKVTRELRGGLLPELVGPSAEEFLVLFRQLSVN